MKLIFDATALRLYPVGKPGFSGGTENMVRALATGLARKGHTLHVVAPDLDTDEQRGPREFWWPAHNHPTSADAVVMVHSLAGVEPYEADLLIYATNGIDCELGPDHAWASAVDAFPVFSETHARLMREARPTIPASKCFVTGLGIDLEDYNAGWWSREPLDAPIREARDFVPKVNGRLLFSNDPARGLWHVLDIFDHLKRDVPEASLSVAYDFSRQFEQHRWRQDALAEAMWDCKRRLATTPGVRSLGALSRSELVREQLACQVHVMPSDPPNVGSQIWGISQMECAAAGSALVLSDIEAFPECFGSAALILPLPGTYLPQIERRYDAADWAEAVAQIIRDPAKWADMSRRSRALAEQNTWDACVQRWDAMLAKLAEAA